jgi:hypothetical protein
MSKLQIMMPLLTAPQSMIQNCLLHLLIRIRKICKDHENAGDDAIGGIPEYLRNQGTQLEKNILKKSCLYIV